MVNGGGSGSSSGSDGDGGDGGWVAVGCGRWMVVV